MTTDVPTRTSFAGALIDSLSAARKAVTAIDFVTFGRWMPPQSVHGSQNMHQSDKVHPGYATISSATLLRQVSKRTMTRRAGSRHNTMSSGATAHRVRPPNSTCNALFPIEGTSVLRAYLHDARAHLCA